MGRISVFDEKSIPVSAKIQSELLAEPPVFRGLAAARPTFDL